MSPLETLAEIERRAAAALHDIATGAATNGVSALQKIKADAADAQRHHAAETGT